MYEKIIVDYGAHNIARAHQHQMFCSCAQRACLPAICHSIFRRCGEAARGLCEGAHTKYGKQVSRGHVTQHSDLNCYQSGRRDLSPPQLVTFLEIKLSKGLRTNILQCISIHSFSCLIFLLIPKIIWKKKPSYNLAVLRVTRQWLE